MARGSVRQRGTTWTVVFDEPRADGRRRQRSKGGFRTRKDAERYLREQLVSLDAGTYMAPRKLTVATYLAEHWLPAMQVRGLRPSTLTRYEDHVRCAITPALGGLPLQRLMPTHLNKLYGDLRAAGRAPKTIRNIHGVLSKALADAERWGLVGRNAARLADVPAVARPRLRVWSPEQTRAFLATVADDRLFAAWLLAATTGMRRGELLGLRWEDIDLDAGVVRVAQARVRAGNQVVAGEPKTARGRRTIALDPATVAALRQHRKRQSEERLAAGPHYADSGLAFTMPGGTPIHPNRFSLWFRRHARAAGLPPIRLHDMRHSYATAGLAAGVPPKVMSERLGHATVAFTLDTYTSALPAMDKSAADVVAGLILGTEEQQTSAGNQANFIPRQTSRTDLP
jgi:integrase